jgi:hypothetical protein
MNRFDPENSQLVEQDPPQHQTLADQMIELLDLHIESGISKATAFKALIDEYYGKTYWLTFDRAFVVIITKWRYGVELYEYRLKNL